MGIAKLGAKHHRIDMKAYPIEEHAFALLCVGDLPTATPLRDSDAVCEDCSHGPLAAVRHGA